MKILLKEIRESDILVSIDGTTTFVIEEIITTLIHRHLRGLKRYNIITCTTMICNYSEQEFNQKRIIYRWVK